jgi:hypothetical protein
MAHYEKSIDVNVPPGRLFAYLSDVRNLPRYLPQMTSAEPADGGDTVHVTARIDPDGSGPEGEREVEGEAWLEVTEPDRSLRWGSESANNYHGELTVDPGADDNASTLTVKIDTEHTGDYPIEEGLAHTLRGIKENVESADRS